MSKRKSEIIHLDRKVRVIEDTSKKLKHDDNNNHSSIELKSKIANSKKIKSVDVKIKLIERETTSTRKTYDLKENLKSTTSTSANHTTSNDMLDINWSILKNRCINGNKQIDLDTTATSVLDECSAMYIMSTIGIINEYLDEKTINSAKKFIDKENKKHAKQINFELNVLKLGNITKCFKCNNLFNDSGICMRNEIERRKKYFVYQTNKEIQNSLKNNELMPFKAIRNENGNKSINDNVDINFYQNALDLLNAID